MTQKPHNPDYRLIETIIKHNGKFVNLVYGITNNGENEGLEAYYLHKRDGHFYRSYRWLDKNIPNVFKPHYSGLKLFINDTLEGHKITL